MDGTCANCAYTNKTASRWCGNWYLDGCNAIEDGIHPLGWDIVEINRTMVTEKCYYWKPESNQMQLSDFITNL